MADVISRDFCPIYWNWRLPGTNQDVNGLRRIACCNYFPNHNEFIRTVARYLLSLIWPVRTFYLIERNTRRFGSQFLKATGKSLLRQRMEQAWLAIWHLVPPIMYYRYAGSGGSLARTARFLHENEAVSIFNYLNGNRQNSAISNKLKFADLCQQHQLPVPPTLGRIVDGKILWSQEFLHAEGCMPSLFVKPAEGFQGEGTAIWRKVSEDHYCRHDGLMLDSQALVTDLQRQFRQKDAVIQPLLENHSAIADLTNGALAAVRVITGRSPDGAIQVCAASFKMPFGRQHTNTHGLSAAIDLETGYLGTAFTYSPVSPVYERHPDTNGEIVGRQLPDWQSVLQLTHHAHELIPEHVFLGWDVALTPDGPILLEGNAGWDVMMIQKPHKRPLPDMPFGDICNLWLEHRYRK